MLFRLTCGLIGLALVPASLWFWGIVLQHGPAELEGWHLPLTIATPFVLLLGVVGWMTIDALQNRLAAAALRRALQLPVPYAARW